MPLNPLTYTVLFTDAAQLKQQSVVQENVDDKLISPIILDVQQVYMQQLMGTQLYTDLQNKIAVSNGLVIDGVPPLNDDEKTLLDIYVTPIMRWLIIRELTTTTSYQFNNKGMLQAFADEARQPTSADINFMRVDAENKYQFYGDRFVSYMNQFFYKFPKYLAVIEFSDIGPSGRSIKTPFALGGSKPGYGMGGNEYGGNGSDFLTWFYLQHR